MHRIRPAIIGLLAVSGLFAGPVAAGDWSSADTERQAAYLILHAVDWRQTRNSAARPLEYRETNLFLGEHPSPRRVDSYFLTTAIIHTGISYALPPGWRRGWQYITIGVEAGVVSWNYSIGVRLDF